MPLSYALEGYSTLGEGETEMAEKGGVTPWLLPLSAPSRPLPRQQCSQAVGQGRPSFMKDYGVRG